MGDLGTWYPITLFLGFFFRYNIYTLHFSFLLHLSIAGYSMYNYAKFKGFSFTISFILGSCFMLSGFFIGNAQHIGWLVSAAWFPFTLLFMEKLMQKSTVKTAIQFAVVMFLLFTGGYPGLFISIFYLLFFMFLLQLYSTYREEKKIYYHRIGYILLSVLFFSLIAAVAIVAALDFSPHISRGEGLSIADKIKGITSGSIPLASVLSFVFPFAFSENLTALWDTDFSMLNIYFSVFLFFTLLFFNFQKGVSKQIRIYTIVGLLFLSLAMGTTFPFRKWLAFLPLFNLFKFPALFRVFTIFYFLIAVGYALKELFQSEEIKKKFVRYLLYLIAVMLCLEVFLLFYAKADLFANFSLPWIELILQTSIAQKIFLQNTLFILLLGVFLILYLYKKTKHSFKILFTSLVLVDILIASQLNFYATVGEKVAPQKLNTLINNLPLGYPIPSLKINQTAINDINLAGEMPMLWRNLPQMYKIPSSFGYTPYAFKSTENSKTNGAYDYLKNRPLLFLASHIKASMIDTSSIDKFSFNKISISSFNPNKIELEVAAQKNEFLVFLQNYYPYWSVYVDNKKQEIIKVNDTFMATSLFKGKHTVVFEFYSQKILVAFYISLSAFFIALFWLIYLYFKKQYTVNHKKSYLLFVLSFAIIIILFWIRFMRTNEVIDYPFINNLIKKNNQQSTLVLLQVDEPSKINSSKNIVFIDDFTPKEIETKLNAINYDNYKSVCFVCFNKLYREVVYQNLSTTFDIQNDLQKNPGFVYFNLSKSTIKNKSILFFNDFEQKPLGNWSSFQEHVDTAHFNSLNHSLKMKPEIEYSSTLTFSAKKINPKAKKMFIEVAYLNVLDEAYLVLDVSRGGKNIIWKSTLLRSNTNENKWKEGYIMLNLNEELKFEMTDVIKIYVWNKNKSTFYLDDFKVYTQY